MLRFVFDQYFAAFMTGAADAVGAAHSPGAQLFALIEFALNHISEWRDHCAVYIDYFSAAREGDERRVSLDTIYESSAAMLRQLIAAAQASGELKAQHDPAVLAELLLSVFDGVVLHGVLASSSCPAEAIPQAALRLVVDGLLTETGRRRCNRATSVDGPDR